MSSHAHTHHATSTHSVKDPVCGMDVDPSASEHTAVLDGATYLFCSAHCRAKFEIDPNQYTATPDESHAGHDLGVAAVSSVPEGEVAEWTRGPDHHRSREFSVIRC